MERANEPTGPMAFYCERRGTGNSGYLNVACSSAKVDGGRLKKYAGSGDEGFIGMMVTDTAFFQERGAPHRKPHPRPAGLQANSGNGFGVGEGGAFSSAATGSVGLPYPAPLSPPQPRNCGRCFLPGKARRRLRWRARRVWFRSSALRRPHLPTQWPRRVVCWSS